MNDSVRVDGSVDVGGLPTIDLEALAASAALQRRFDRKYVVEMEALPGLLEALGRETHVLEVGGRRSSDYSSVYFDTPDLRTYRDHVQRRRRRFKVRTRHYGDPTSIMLEVKCKGRRGQTVKHRWAHPGADAKDLDQHAHRLVARALWEQYEVIPPSELRPLAETTFERITLVDVGSGERVTIDLDLTIFANGRSVRLGSSHAVVETKTPARHGSTTRALRSLGLRPEPVSKYCVGIAASHDSVRGNPWMGVLRRLDQSTTAAELL